VITAEVVPNCSGPGRRLDGLRLRFPGRRRSLPARPRGEDGCESPSVRTEASLSRPLFSWKYGDVPTLLDPSARYPREEAWHPAVDVGWGESEVVDEGVDRSPRGGSGYLDVWRECPVGGGSVHWVPYSVTSYSIPRGRPQPNRRTNTLVRTGGDQCGRRSTGKGGDRIERFRDIR